MIFYHGTTLQAAKSIQKIGLVPHRETAYQLEFDGDKLRDLPGENEPYIYLQSMKSIAENYARFRAAYEKASYGQKIVAGHNLNDAVKITTKRNAKAKPALITFDIPQSIAENFQMDEQNWIGGHVCLCTIPPSFITSVTPL